MPRKKEYFQFKDSLSENLVNAVQQTFELKQEFINEIQEAPLLHFWYTSTDAGNPNFHLGIVLLKRFAVVLFRYRDNDRGGEWPTRPLYAAPEANDTVYFYFWRSVPGNVHIREFELQDFDVELHDENDDGKILEEYVNKIYYDRKRCKWTGWSATSTTWGFGRENPPIWPHNSIIGSDELLNYPDDSNGQDSSGEWTPDDLFKFWLKTKIHFEGVPYSAFELEVVPTKEEQRIDEINEMLAEEREQDLLHDYTEIEVKSIDKMNQMRDMEVGNIYHIHTRFLESWVYYDGNQQEIYPPKINENGMVYWKDVKWKNMPVKPEKQFWPFDPELATIYFGNIGWFAPATFQVWGPSVELFKDYGLLVGSISDTMIDSGYRRNLYTIERTPIILIQPKAAFGRENDVLQFRYNKELVTDMGKAATLVYQQMRVYTNTVLAKEMQHVAVIKDNKMVVYQADYLGQEYEMRLRPAQYPKTLRDFANYKSNQYLRSAVTSTILYITLAAVKMAAYGKFGSVYDPTQLGTDAGQDFI